MKLVAAVRPASSDGASAALAAATGLAPAEARMRLAPEPPALLARLPPEQATTLVAALRSAGLAALAVEAAVPTDADRTVGRTFALEPQGLTVSPRVGEPMTVAWSDVAVVLRGVRSSRVDVDRTEKTKKLAIGTALATGGLVTSRTSTKTVRSSEETMEQVILVYAHDGRVATLAESRLEFSGLGPRKQPASTANMLELARALRVGAPAAFYDERLLRLGRRPLPFLAGGESRSQTATVTTTRTDTSGSFDVVAELLRTAVAEGLLP